MRSAAMAWALDLYGFEVRTIRGGYKSFRHWALRQCQRTYPLSVIGGMTGSGKTRILTRLHASGEQIIDLEDLAQHQGSTYGSLNRLIQPTQEQFENNLTNSPEWTPTGPSGSKTKARTSADAFSRSRSDATAQLDLLRSASSGGRPRRRPAAEYGDLDKDFLVESTERIARRLGPEQTKAAVTAIREGRMADFIRQVLVYYDKMYRKGLITRDPNNIIPIIAPNGNVIANADHLLSIAQNRASPHHFDQ